MGAEHDIPRLECFTASRSCLRSAWVDTFITSSIGRVLQTISYVYPMSTRQHPPEAKVSSGTRDFHFFAFDILCTIWSVLTPADAAVFFSGILFRICRKEYNPSSSVLDSRVSCAPARYYDILKKPTDRRTTKKFTDYTVVMIGFCIGFHQVRSYPQVLTSIASPRLLANNPYCGSYQLSLEYSCGFWYFCPPHSVKFYPNPGV